MTYEIEWLDENYEPIGAIKFTDVQIEKGMKITMGTSKRAALYVDEGGNGTVDNGKQGQWTGVPLPLFHFIFLSRCQGQVVFFRFLILLAKKSPPFP